MRITPNTHLQCQTFLRRNEPGKLEAGLDGGSYANPSPRRVVGWYSLPLLSSFQGNRYNPPSPIQNILQSSNITSCVCCIQIGILQRSRQHLCIVPVLLLHQLIVRYKIHMRNNSLTRHCRRLATCTSSHRHNPSYRTSYVLCSCCYPNKP